MNRRFVGWDKRVSTMPATVTSPPRSVGRARPASDLVPPYGSRAIIPISVPFACFRSDLYAVFGLPAFVTCPHVLCVTRCLGRRRRARWNWKSPAARSRGPALSFQEWGRALSDAGVKARLRAGQDGRQAGHRDRRHEAIAALQGHGRADPRRRAGRARRTLPPQRVQAAGRVAGRPGQARPARKAGKDLPPSASPAASWRRSMPTLPRRSISPPKACRGPMPSTRSPGSLD